MTAPPGQGLRLFVAVELGADALRALGELQTELRRKGLAALRWVRPEGIHLTLKFLGEVPAAAVPDIERALAGAVKGVPPHTLRLGALGKFGGRGSPRVLWVDMAGDQEVVLSLQQRVEGALNRLGFPRERRRFSPHLTLARVPPEGARAAAGPLDEAIAAVHPQPAEIQVRELSLMRSQLGPGGAVYTRLFAVALEAT
ncbi:MAG: RNA 2',3'-cyclic phosphodiesterase [Dehalococcoidia bacterium]|nr:RNA 2',3'-cyclic phosphodiesterase [Dehalococcoidia bacterium]